MAEACIVECTLWSISIDPRADHVIYYAHNLNQLSHPHFAEMNWAPLDKQAK
jgi:hypothetical protein